MKVPFVYGPHDLRLCDVDAPEAGPRDVLLRIATVGICGSDLGYIKMGGVVGPTSEPFPLGHELSGTVEQAGEEVTSVKVGDRVILNPLINMVGNGAPEGGFGEHLLVRDVVSKPENLLTLPDSISFDHGALVEPLAVSAHAVSRMGVKAGDKVAIFGAGPIGLAAIIAMKHRGVDDIVAFDLSAFRRERALQLGAKAAFDPRETPAPQALGEAHGTVPFRGLPLPATKHYLEASGAPILGEMIGFASHGASICVASSHKQAIEIDPNMLLAKELTFMGTLGYPTELGEVMDMLDQNAFDPEAMVSHRFPADDVMAAFDLAKQANESAKVLVQYAA